MLLDEQLGASLKVLEAPPRVPLAAGASDMTCDRLGHDA
jgi:hypothetical protein